MSTAGETWYTTAKWKILRREDFKYQFAEGTLVRFVVLQDRRHIESIVNYVSSLADSSSIVADGNTIDGTWQTVSAGISPVNQNDPLGDVMVWHALVPAALSTSDGPYVTENNCTYKVSLTYYWRRASLPSAVTAGSSGVTYKVTDQIRDPKSGLWSYAIEKREQITTYVASHKIADSQFATVYQQKILGVRTGDTDDTGAAISSLWTVDTSVQGTSITENRTKNENCTVDIVQTKTVAKSAEAVVSRTRTLFGDVVTITLRNQTTAVNAYVAVANGIVYTRESKKNDDNTFDNTETQRIATEGVSLIESTQTIFSSRVTITSRNQSTSVSALVTVSGGIVTIRGSKKNEDGTYDNTETILTAIEAQNAIVERYQTVFEIGVSITHRNQTTAVNALVTVSGGVITRRTSKKNEDGTYDNTESTTTAVAASNAVIEKTQDAFSQGVTITNRNQSEAVADFVTVANGIITAQTAVMNPDNTWNNTQKTVTAVEAQNAVIEKYQTAYEIGVSITNRNMSAAVAEFVEVSGGVITKQTAVENPDKTWNNTQTLTTKRADVQRSKRTTVQGLDTITDTDTQQVTTIPDDVSAQTAGTAVTRIKTTNEAGGTDVRELIESGAKWSQTWTVSDVNGDYTITDFANYTLEEIQALLTALGADTSNQFYSPGPPNKYGKYDGRIRVNPVTGGETAYAYTTGDNVDTLTRLVPRDGKIIKEVYTILYDTARGFGVALGRANYSNKSPKVNWGSEFHDVGHNWYWFKAVTAVTLATTDVTAAYNSGSVTL